MGGQLLSKSDNPALVYTSLRRLTEEGHHVAVVFESRLLRAVQQNKHEVALYLIKNKIDLNVVEHGFSAMNLSIHRRNREVVDALINSGCDLNICDDSHLLPPLFHAVAQNLPDLVKQLLHSGCDVNLQIKGETALHIAVQTVADPVNLLEILVEYGIDISVCDKEGVSALHLCAKYGHVKTAKLLLNNTSYEICDLATNSRNTALHIALQHDQWIVAEVLLSNGCSPAVQNDQGQTPLVSAIIAGHFMCAQKLLSNSDPLKYIDLVDRRRFGALHHIILASKHGKTDPEILDVLLKAGANINLICEDVNAMTPLHTAATYGELKLLRSLLRGDADVNMKIRASGKTPLFIACEIGNEAVAQILLEHGTDADQEDKFGVTPLYVSASRGHIAVTKLLLVWGASVNHTDKRNRSALLMSARSGNTSIASILLKAGAHPDNYDQNGKGPIHAAIAFPCMDMILLNLLIEAGCDPLNIEEFIRIMLETGILTPENMGVYLRKWYVTEKTNPKSLKRLCRHSIRGRLITLMRCQVQEEQPLQSACEKLPLPSIIQKYISVRFIE